MYILLLLLFSIESSSFDYSELVVEEKIGEGAYAQVFKGKYKVR